MNADHGMTTEAIEECIRGTLAAGLANDETGMEAAMAPLFEDSACVWDAFTWTMGMIGVALQGTPIGPNSFAIPLITKTDPVTGKRTEFHADDAPEGTPRALVALMRLKACYVNQDRDGATTVWANLIEEEAAKESPEGPTALADLMVHVMHEAIGKAREVRARSMFRLN